MFPLLVKEGRERSSRGDSDLKNPHTSQLARRFALTKKFCLGGTMKQAIPILPTNNNHTTTIMSIHRVQNNQATHVYSKESNRTYPVSFFLENIPKLKLNDLVLTSHTAHGITIIGRCIREQGESSATLQYDTLDIEAKNINFFIEQKCIIQAGNAIYLN